MDLFLQIMMGTAMLALCSVVHVACIAGIVPYFHSLAATTGRLFPGLKVFVLLCFGLIAIVIAHSAQVWIWAASLVVLGAFETLEAAIYFSLVTYTTVGYGDVTLQSDLRIFGAFASVTGLLTFGISTAFLVGLLARILPKNFT